MASLRYKVGQRVKTQFGYGVIAKLFDYGERRYGILRNDAPAHIEYGKNGYSHRMDITMFEPVVMATLKKK